MLSSVYLQAQPIQGVTSAVGPKIQEMDGQLEIGGLFNQLQMSRGGRSRGLWWWLFSPVPNPQYHFFSLEDLTLLKPRCPLVSIRAREDCKQSKWELDLKSTDTSKSHNWTLWLLIQDNISANVACRISLLTLFTAVNALSFNQESCTKKNVFSNL